MPYTPPSRSPAASYASSPVHTPGLRPQLPRSNSSTSYIQRHRRSPSAPNLVVENGKIVNGHLAGMASIRQSPPPVTDAAMPAGAMLSPPDSTQNSSDEESSPASNRDGSDLHELHDAFRRSLDVNRQSGSPQNEAGHSHGVNRFDLPNSDSGSEGFAPPQHPSSALSTAARKISHSRSATESSFFDLPFTQSTAGSLDNYDDSEEDPENGEKPPLLRKKSGELVKPAIRPQSRRKHSSMPGTPTFSKAVHFNEDIEQVRHFLQVDRPIAVSAGASPVDGHDEDTEFPFALQAPRNVEWELNLKNSPRESLARLSSPVRVERLYLSQDQKSLLGVVAVANLAFNKSVVARFTLDYWKTTSEVAAEYNNDKNSVARNDGYDQFNFSIKLSDQANLEARTLLLCVRYNVNGQEYWDNNDSMNFQADFVKKEKPAEQTKPVEATSAARPIPRSRHNSSSSTARPRSMPSFEDDFSRGFDVEPIKFRASGDTPPRRRQVPGGAQFSTRYDFGASLSAALSQAQRQLGSSSGITAKGPTAHGGQSDATRSSQPAPGLSTIPSRTGVIPSAPSRTETPRPDTLLAKGQSLDSRAYQDFVSKYCFFGSNNKTTHPAQGSSESPSGNDGAQDDPLSRQSDPKPGFYDVQYESSMEQTPDDSAAVTPVPRGISGTRSPLPSFGYPFSPESRSGLMTPDYHTPTAIQG